MKIKIDFGCPYFDEETIFKLSHLDDFYTDENDVNRISLFFVLEATLHKFQGKNSVKAAARCAFLMAYYLFIPLTPPATYELAAFYIDKALELDERSEYRHWKEAIDEDLSGR